MPVERVGPEPLLSPAERILASADEAMTQRAASRDQKQERSMADVVKAFNAIYGTDLTEEQGWAFMVMLKLKRASLPGYREDDFVDGAAYFALWGESRGPI